MLVGAGLATHSLWNLTRVDLGVRTDHMVGFYLNSPAAPSNRRQINSYYRNMLARIEAVPGVTSVTALSHLPLDSLHETTHFRIAGSPEYLNLSSGPSADI
jgi:putative ABC transport system permease protein